MIRRLTSGVFGHIAGMAASGSDGTSTRPHRQAIGIGHHYDGCGYVGNRQADLIGYWGAIGAIVDAYDAIISERVFRQPLSAEEDPKANVRMVPSRLLG